MHTPPRLFASLWALFLMQLILFFTPVMGVENSSRTVLAVYDSTQMEPFQKPPIQANYEMVLNHLGVKLEMLDFSERALPKPKDYRGIFVYLSESEPERAAQFWKWLNAALDDGVKVIFFRNLGPSDPMQAPVLDLMGIETGAISSHFPAHIKVLEADARAIPFERPFANEIGLFNEVHIREGVPLLVLQHSPTGATSNPIAILPLGGIVLDDTDVYQHPNSPLKQFYFNPFFFLNEALGLQDTPRPDVTTINGMRLFYSHIDGDGIGSPTYYDRALFSGEAIYKDVLLKYPMLPMTVSVISATIDPTFRGSKDMVALSQKIFKLPNVELASHTFSHPLIWDRKLVPENAADGYKQEVQLKTFNNDALLPWRMSNYSYSPEAEIQGSISYINRVLAPEGKRCELIFWSGNCFPNEQALAVAEVGDILNINGGDSRFDGDFPSYLGLSSFYRKVGPYYQIHSSNANENIYTELWSSQFGGYQNVIETFKNTDSPRRVSAMNVYYHFYSGERKAALTAVQKVIDFALNSDIFPVYAKRYIQTVHGFISTRISRLSESA
jgi:polysaccharide biosynthesis protein PelA